MDEVGHPASASEATPQFTCDLFPGAPSSSRRHCSQQSPRSVLQGGRHPSKMIQMPLQCWRSCQAGGEAGTSLSKARLGYEHQSGTEQISKSLHRSLIPGHTSTAAGLDTCRNSNFPESTRRDYGSLVPSLKG